MMINRVIPCLLLRNKGLVKTVKFKDYTYLGDPINAVKIFNEKEVDELIFLDIDVSADKKEPSYKLIKKIANECFMPFCYGGGITNTYQIQKIIKAGAEKVSINTSAFLNPNFIKEAANIFGSSTIIVSIDVKKNIFGQYKVYINNGKKNINLNPVDAAKLMEKMGAGELLINSIDKDGTMTGYDIDLIKKISENVGIPVIACGGAGKIDDFAQVVKQGGASAAAAGSFFVFQGKRRAVLITYPPYESIKEIFS